MKVIKAGRVDPLCGGEIPDKKRSPQEIFPAGFFAVIGEHALVFGSNVTSSMADRQFQVNRL